VRAGLCAHRLPWYCYSELTTHPWWCTTGTGECKAKVEEDAIVAREVDTLKRRLADPEVDKSRLQEYLLRLIYVEMLGHSASFGYIHAVKLTCEHNLPNKRVGYLAVSLFLDDSHDLLILIVNTLQQDLKSNDPLTGALSPPCAYEDNHQALRPGASLLSSHSTNTHQNCVPARPRSGCRADDGRQGAVW